MRLPAALGLALLLSGCSRYELPEGRRLLSDAIRQSYQFPVSLQQANVVLDDGHPCFTQSRVLRSGPARARADIVAGDGIAASGPPLIVVRDGRRVWRSIPGQDKVQFSSMPVTSLSLDRRLRIILSNYDVVTTGREQVAGRQAYLIEMRPHQPGRGMGRLWLDVESPAILRQEEWGHDGRLLSVTNATTAPERIDRVVAREQFRLPSHGEPGEVMAAMPPSDLRRALGYQPGTLGYLPTGFEVVGAYLYRCPLVMGPCARWELTDGRVSLSVFQTRQPIPRTAGTRESGDSRGGMVALPVGPYHIIVRGSLPTAELIRVARGVRLG